MIDPNDPELQREIARAICRVQLNGADPNQPAVRWNGTECEPQDFPAWQDYRDEAFAAIHAYLTYEDQVIALRNEQAEREADAREA